MTTLPIGTRVQVLAYDTATCRHAWGETGTVAADSPDQCRLEAGYRMVRFDRDGARQPFRVSNLRPLPQTHTPID